MELGHLSLLSYIVRCAWQKMAVPQQSATISIRRATSDDAPGILACLREAFKDYRHSYTPDAFLDTVLTPETIHERLAKMIVFVAVSPSRQIAGTIACNVVNHDEGHLRGMAVCLAWRGTGLAAQLLSHAESELRRRKCARITLDTTGNALGSPSTPPNPSNAPCAFTKNMATAAPERFRIFSVCLCSNTTNNWCAKTLPGPDPCFAVPWRRTEPAGNPASSCFSVFLRPHIPTIPKPPYNIPAHRFAAEETQP